MTVIVDYSPLEYAGNGAAVTFPVTWPFIDGADVVVGIKRGTVLTYLPRASYGVTQTTSGGSVTLVTPPASGETVRIERATPLRQPDVLRTGGEYSPRTVELMHDRAIMLIQQLAASALQVVHDDLTGEFVWDAKGSRIIRVGDAKAEQDAVNLRSLFAIVEQIQNGGGSVAVSPKYWEFTGDGEDDLIELPGADVSDPLFYDVVVAGLTLEPYDEYVIEHGPAGDMAVRFMVPPADGAEGFVILRGMARPAAADLRRIPIVNVTDESVTLDRGSEFALLRCTNPAGCIATIKPAAGGQQDFMDGSYFSVTQKGDAPVELRGGDGVTVHVPAGFVAKTRAQHSVISATCESATANVWVITGDMAEG